MAEFEKGLTFHDKTATNFDGEKGKYFIGLTDAEFEDDIIVSFVINTEHRMDKYRIGCNKEAEKYILEPKQFSFLKNYSSIMLDQSCGYLLKEMYEKNIELFYDDKADDNLCRRIKNCINFDSIPTKYSILIKECFK